MGFTTVTASDACLLVNGRVKKQYVYGIKYSGFNV